MNNPSGGNLTTMSSHYYVKSHSPIIHILFFSIIVDDVDEGRLRATAPPADDVQASPNSEYTVNRIKEFQVCFKFMFDAGQFTFLNFCRGSLKAVNWSLRDC